MFLFFYCHSFIIIIIKEIKGDVKIRTHDPLCCRSAALTSELLRTRWRARVIFVGWTCEPHHAVTLCSEVRASDLEHGG